MITAKLTSFVSFCKFKQEEVMKKMQIIFVVAIVFACIFSGLDLLNAQSANPKKPPYDQGFKRISNENIGIVNKDAGDSWEGPFQMTNSTKQLGLVLSHDDVKDGKYDRIELRSFPSRESAKTICSQWFNAGDYTILSDNSTLIDNWLRSDIKGSEGFFYTSASISDLNGDRWFVVILDWQGALSAGKGSVWHKTN